MPTRDDAWMLWQPPIQPEEWTATLYDCVALKEGVEDIKRREF